MKEPETEANIAPEAELREMSNKVCEPATLCDYMGILVEYEGMEEGTIHIPAIEGELQLAFAKCLLE